MFGYTKAHYLFFFSFFRYLFFSTQKCFVFFSHDSVLYVMTHRPGEILAVEINAAHSKSDIRVNQFCTAPMDN